MSNQSETPPQSPSDKVARAATRARAVLILVALVGLESLALWICAGVLVIDTITLRPSDYASAVALTVLTVVGAVWLVAVAVALHAGRPWSRAGAMTWQILQLAVAVGAFQGVFAQPAIGWAILVPSLLGIGLLLTRSVVAHTRRDDLPS